MSKKVTVERCIALAASKNGKYIGTHDVDATKPLKWKCEYEHIFHKSWKHVAYDKSSWCPECKGNNRMGEQICRAHLETIFGKQFNSIRPEWLKYSFNKNLELDGYCAELNIAFEHNGIWHTEQHPFFHNANKTLLDRITKDKFKVDKCAENGVKLIVIPELFKRLKLNELRSFIINECKNLDISIPDETIFLEADLSKIGIAKIKICELLAHQKHGQCLSKNYLHAHGNLLWQCYDNHIWEATYNNVVCHGTWCPECAGVKKLTIEDAYALARSHGGLCLSTDYFNNSELLDWQCKNGHTWSATMTHVRNNNSWCSRCAFDEQRLGIDVAHMIAATKNGKCLSIIYKNNREKLSWQCEQKHIWQASLHKVKDSGTWCPICAGRKPKES